MKKFTKLVLVSSMAISANAMAMQAMDDAALSTTTGQDGINIGIGITKVQIDKLYVHDNDGLSETATNKVEGVSVTGISNGAPTFSDATVISNSAIAGGTGKAGAIAIDGITITANNASLLNSHNLMDLQIDSDAGKNGAFLNIAAQVSGLNIKIGEISVAASGDAATGRRGVVAGSQKAILSGLTITTGQMAANIQLGSTPQGAMIKLNTTMQGGLTISDLGILDNAGGGQITLGKLSVADAPDAGSTTSSGNLTIAADVAVTDKGLKITSTQNASGTDIYVQGIALGAKPLDSDWKTTSGTSSTLLARGSSLKGSIGDVEVQGLKTWYDAAYTKQGSIITVTGR